MVLTEDSFKGNGNKLQSEEIRCPSDEFSTSDGCVTLAVTREPVRASSQDLLRIRRDLRPAIMKVQTCLDEEGQTRWPFAVLFISEILSFVVLQNQIYFLLKSLW